MPDQGFLDFNTHFMLDVQTSAEAGDQLNSDNGSIMAGSGAVSYSIAADTPVSLITSQGGNQGAVVDFLGSTTPNTLSFAGGGGFNGLGLVLLETVTGQIVTVFDGLGTAATRIASLAFSDGTTLSYSSILQTLTNGSATRTQLYGDADANVIDSHGYARMAQGNGGGDTFVYQTGYGTFAINEVDLGASPSNKLQFGTGIAAAMLTVSGDAAGNMYLGDGMAGDQITLIGQLTNAANGVQSVSFADGSSIAAAQLVALETAGTTGADKLYGSTAAEIIDGQGAPTGQQDYVQGNGGGDTFVYQAGYGHLEIKEVDLSATANNFLQLGQAITAAQLTITGDAFGNLYIADGISGDLIQLDNQLNGNTNGLQTVRFADGSTLSSTQLIVLEQTGTSEVDNLFGTSGADIFDGGGAPAGLQDYANGNGGGDTFIFNAGYGHLEIYETDSTVAPNNTLQFGAGITVSQIKVTLDMAGGYYVTDGMSGDRVELDNVLYNIRWGIQKVAFADGTSLTAAQLIAIGATGTPGSDFLGATFAPQVFDGRGAPTGGKDVVYGSGAGDTIIFNAGYGQLEISEPDAVAPNILRFGSGISAGQLGVTSDIPGNLYVTDGIAGDRIQIDGRNGTISVQKATFADNSDLSAVQLLAMATIGTSNADTLNGPVTGAVFDGKGAPSGSQDLERGKGGDTFIYNQGYGQLEIADLSSSILDSVLRFGPGITVSTLRVTQDIFGVISVADGIPGDKVKITNGGALSLQFDDGSGLSIEQLQALATTGTSSADVLTGRYVAEVFDGKGAPTWSEDLVQGGGGGDTFIFNQGYGKLHIDEMDGSGIPNPGNSIQFGPGILASKITVQYDASHNMYITDGMPGDQIQIDSQGLHSYTPDFGAAVHGIQTIMFANGSSLSSDQLAILAMVGTSGADTIFGTSSADVIDGKGAPAGAQDYLNGNGGDDTFVFNSGYGRLEVDQVGFAFWGSMPNSTLQFGAGITAAQLMAYGDQTGKLFIDDGISGDEIQLDGQLNNDGHGIQNVTFVDGSSLTSSQLAGLIDGTNRVTGTTGADTLSGSSSADTFDGKGAPSGSQDVENGAGGSDIFVFDAGYGQLEIAEDAGTGKTTTATLRLGAGITAGNLTVTSDGTGNFYLGDGTPGDRIKIDGQLNGTSGAGEYGIAQVRFADGSTLSAQQLSLLSTGRIGTTGADNLSGTKGAETFDGKGAPSGTQDYESGGGGADTFSFNPGYGQLEISEDAGSAAITTATLQLGTSITISSLVVTSDAGGNVYVGDGTAGDLVKIDGQMNGPLGSGEYGVATIQLADGSKLTAQQLEALADIGSTANTRLYGTRGADVFDGRGYAFYAQGNGGSDTFVFNQGYGPLEINEVDASSNAANTLKLGSGIAPSQVKVTSDSSGNLILTDATAGDRITLDAQLKDASKGVQSVQFADGTTWSRAHLAAEATRTTKTGTTAANNLYGTAGAEQFDGQGAPAGKQDYVEGEGGYDVFVFKSGYGHLEISETDTGPNPGNALRLGSGITFGQVRVVGDASENLILTDGTSGDQVTLDSALNSGIYGVQTVQFADGTSLSRAQLIGMATTGTTGADMLYGSDGAADILDGKGAPLGSKDYAQGNGGNDTFIFNRGYGQLVVSEADTYVNPANILKLGSDITLGQVKVVGDDSENLIVTDGTSGDQVILDSALNSAIYGVQTLQFADGTSLSRTQLIVMATTGTSGADMLYGSDGAADILDGKGALSGSKDYAQGNGGNDTFIFNRGYGQLEVSETDTAVNPANILKLGSDITLGQLKVVGDDSENLIVTDGTSGDQVILDSALNSAIYGVQTLQFADGTSLSRAQLIVMATTGTSGADMLYGSDGAADVLDGKGAPSGSKDYAQGNGGNDAFIFNKGYGQLEISETDTGVNHANVLRLGGGITPGQLKVAGDGSDNLILTDGTSGDQITIDVALDGSTYGVQSVLFGDGTSLSRAQLITMATTGTTGADNLYGSYAADTLDGKGAPSGAQDYLQGNGGNDTFVFNLGYGQLEIGENDTSTTAANVLKLGSGMIHADIKSAKSSSGADVVLTVGSNGDQVTLDQMLSNTSAGVQTMQFLDGSSWTGAQIKFLAKNGSTAANTINGTTGNDVFDGRGGADTITGKGGYDTYLFRKGYGALTIANGATNGTVASGELDLGAGLTEKNLWFANSANNLVITELNSKDTVTIKNWFAGSPGAQLSQVVGYDGMKLDAKLPNLVTAMATYVSNHAGFNPATATQMPTDTTLQAALTSAWHS